MLNPIQQRSSHLHMSYTVFPEKPAKEDSSRGYNNFLIQILHPRFLKKQPVNQACKNWIKNDFSHVMGPHSQALPDKTVSMIFISFTSLHW